MGFQVYIDFRVRSMSATRAGNLNADPATMQAEPDRNAARPARALRLVQLDGRTRQGRRLAAIVAELTERVGGEAVIAATPGLADAVADAAELRLAAEDARARYLAGDGIGADDLVRLERLAGLREKRLPIERTAPAAPMSIRERLRQQAGA